MWVSTWVCFGWWSTKHFWWSAEHFTTWLFFIFHPNIQVFHLQPIRFHKASTQHMAIMKVCHFWEESLSVNQKTSNRQHPSMVSTAIYVSIVIFNVVDHTFMLKLSDGFSCNLIHWWHMPKLAIQIHYGHLLSLFSKLITDEWLDSLWHQTRVPLYLASSWTQALTPWSEIPYTSSQVSLHWSVKYSLLFHFTIFTPNCKCHLVWHLLSHSWEWVSALTGCHSLNISHMLEVWLVTFTPLILYNSSLQPTSFTS